MTVSSQLRKSCLRLVGSRAVRESPFARISNVASTRTLSSWTSERVASLQARGVLDDEGCTNFQTLHELQLSACSAFEKNSLFGTYIKKGEGGAFQWMNYHDFSALVSKTRAVLKDIGKIWSIYSAR
jgi:hypothetical protein